MRYVLPERVKERLSSLGKTQEWLADQLDLSKPAITNWIKDGVPDELRKKPRADNLLKMAEVLQCHAGYLLDEHTITPAENRLLKMVSGWSNEQIEALIGTIDALHGTKAEPSMRLDLDKRERPSRKENKNAG